MRDLTIGFLGLGSMGFPMCYGLFKSGYSLVLPTFRKEIDATGGFSPLVPEYESKLALINEMLDNGAIEATCLEEQVAMSDVILISMPSSKQVEDLVLSPNGILNCAKEGSVVIDLTTADPNSTKRLAQLLEGKGIEMLDAPVSGGTSGAINQSLSIMVGGKEEVYEKVRPILEVIGAKEKLLYIGPIGSGHTIKLVNNYLSAVGTIATTEALMVTTKAGISPQRAIDVLKDSGGRNDATMNKFPNYVLPNKKFNFTINLMCKDLGLYTQAAKDLNVPSFISNNVYQVWGIPQARGEGEEDVMNVIKMFEEWCGVNVIGTGEISNN